MVKIPSMKQSRRSALDAFTTWALGMVVRKILLLILLLPMSISAVSISYAWWVDYSYTPLLDSFEGKKAEFYNPNFSHIEIYSCETERFFTKEQCDEIAKNQGMFNLVLDANNDDELEEFLIGIAKNKNGEYPYSNIILIRNAKTKELLEVLKIDSPRQAFLIFLDTENSLSVFLCMECGNYADIEWVNEKWMLKWPEPY